MSCLPRPIAHRPGDHRLSTAASPAPGPRHGLPPFRSCYGSLNRGNPLSKQFLAASYMASARPVRVPIGPAVAFRPVWPIESTSNSPVRPATPPGPGAPPAPSSPGGRWAPSWSRPAPGSARVLRAEVETTLDGTSVVALLPPKGKTEVRSVERIEVVGTPRKGPDVNVVLASKGKRRRDDGQDGPRDGSRRPSERRPRTADGDKSPASSRTRRRDGADSETGRDCPRSGQHDRARAGPLPSPRHPARPGAREAGRPGPSRRPAASAVYRNAALATLKPEELPVAEQLLRGGIPAVRQAIEEQNARARAGRTAGSHSRATPGHGRTVATGRQLGHLEGPRLGGAHCRQGHPLRELRSIVASSSTVTLDDEGTELATALRAALHQRITALRERWVERITTSLDDGRVLDAVRASIRPPEPSARLSAELAVRLSEAAGKSMAPDTTPENWLALLEVVVESPVRRTVKPAGLPVGADESLLQQARKASGYVPELARLMGIPIPPPPGPRRPVPARAGRRAS